MIHRACRTPRAPEANRARPARAPGTVDESVTLRATLASDDSSYVSGKRDGHRRRGAGAMIKVVVLLRRSPSWSRERFHRWWIDEHVPTRRGCPISGSTACAGHGSTSPRGREPWDGIARGRPGSTRTETPEHLAPDHLQGGRRASPDRSCGGDDQRLDADVRVGSGVLDDLRRAPCRARSDPRARSRASSRSRRGSSRRRGRHARASSRSAAIPCERLRGQTEAAASRPQPRCAPDAAR